MTTLENGELEKCTSFIPTSERELVFNDGEKTGRQCAPQEAPGEKGEGEEGCGRGTKETNAKSALVN